MLQLMPMEESDLYDYVTIFSEAFKNDIMALMYPNGYSEEDKKFGIESNLKQWREHPDRLKFMKIIDTELPGDDVHHKMVGAAKWEFHPQDRSEAEPEEKEKEPKDRPVPPGANAPFLKEFFETIKRCKQEVVGAKAHAMLSVLFTRPGYYRKGIGAMHLEWGLEQADKLDLQTYVEGGAMGKPLYERFGFREIIPLPLNARKWGLSYDLPYFCMIRAGKIE